MQGYICIFEKAIYWISTIWHTTKDITDRRKGHIVQTYFMSGYDPFACKAKASDKPPFIIQVILIDFINTAHKEEIHFDKTAHELLRLSHMSSTAGDGARLEN